MPSTVSAGQPYFPLADTHTDCRVLPEVGEVWVGCVYMDGTQGCVASTGKVIHDSECFSAPAWLHEEEVAA